MTPEQRPETENQEAEIAMNPIKIRRWLTAAALALTTSAGVAQDVAETFLTHLEAQRFEKAHAMLADATGAALTESQLRRTWEALPAPLGEYRGRGGFREENIAGRAIQTARLEFSAMALDARISVDARLIDDLSQWVLE